MVTQTAASSDFGSVWAGQSLTSVFASVREHEVVRQGIGRGPNFVTTIPVEVTVFDWLPSLDNYSIASGLHR